MSSIVTAKASTSKIVHKLLLGQCWPSKVPNAARIIVKTLEFDDYLKMYFPRNDAHYAHDPESICRTGDMVLISRLPSNLTRDISHRVLSVVYPCGDITDPISGEKCSGTLLRSTVERMNELWGPNPENSFKYEERPPTGSQQGKLDWSHKETYRKWHEFLDKDQPESVPW